MDILIEIQYLPPIRFFSKLFTYNRIVIDDMEGFEKQTYRTRALIAGANGVLPLIIPVKKAKAIIPIHEVLIDQRSNWQRQHWQSIQSAYGKSPFFENYADKLEPLYRKDFKFLFDADWAFLEAILEMLKLPPERIAIRSELIELNETVFYKDEIHPKNKKEDAQFNPYHYIQVFPERFGFLPNLSIIDLLFNMGPETKSILQKSSVLNLDSELSGN